MTQHQKARMCAVVFLLVASNADAKTWFTVDDSYQCKNLGSPADHVRRLASRGIHATPSDDYRDGIVAVKYETADGTTGNFFYPSKELCEDMVRMMMPVDSKYE
ncbi:hypothetical protein ACJRW5_23800 [Pseudomonas sp. SH1-B]